MCWCHRQSRWHPEGRPADRLIRGCNGPRPPRTASGDIQAIGRRPWPLILHVRRRRTMALGVRPDPILEARRRVAPRVAIVLFVAALIPILWWPATNWVTLLGMLGFILALLSMAWPTLFYRCPACRMRLRRGIWLAPVLDETGGSPLHFVCPRCEVEWDTGLRGGGFGSD